MISILLAIAGALFLIATSMLIVASLRLSSPAALVLGTYVVAWAEVVALTEVLSVFRGVRAAWYLGSEALVFAGVMAIWVRLGRPLPPLPSRVGVRPVLRAHPIVACLGAVVALALAYEAFVGLSTPGTDIDELWYHLPRAAAWLHHGGLERIPAGNAAENDYPPNAEIGVLYGFAFLHRDTFATLPQLAAQLSLVVVVAGLARRLGSSIAAALFAGLLTLTLSDVALEATTALNDIVVASFVGVAAYFILDTRSRSHLVLAGVSVGLALGTKYTAGFALPALALLALVALPRRRLARLVAAAAIGFALFGAYSYAANLYRSHTLLGSGATEIGTAPSSVTVRGTVSTTARNAYRFLDLSGYRVQTRLLDPIATIGKDVFRALHIPTAPPEASTGGSPFVFDVNVYSTPGTSWYGPLGALLIVPLSVVFCGAWLARKVGASTGALAIALPLYLASTALAYRYTSQGRFFITPIVLTLPLAASLYRRRLLAGAIAAVAALTLFFALVYDQEKPTGLAGNTPIWELARPDAQALVFNHGVAELIRAVDRLPSRENLGVAAKQLYFGYALYGPTLQRDLIPVASSNPIADADRLGLRALFIGSATSVSRRRGWTEEFFPGAGTLLVRSRRA